MTLATAQIARQRPRSTSSVGIPMVLRPLRGLRFSADTTPHKAHAGAVTQPQLTGRHEARRDRDEWPTIGRSAVRPHSWPPLHCRLHGPDQRLRAPRHRRAEVSRRLRWRRPDAGTAARRRRDPVRPARRRDPSRCAGAGSSRPRTVSAPVIAGTRSRYVVAVPAKSEGRRFGPESAAIHGSTAREGAG